MNAPFACCCLLDYWSCPKVDLQKIRNTMQQYMLSLQITLKV